MNKQNYLTQIQEFGLDEVEALIYFHLLQNGKQTPLELSRALNIDRSKIYRSVEKLTKMRLIQDLYARWGKKLQAVDPQSFALILQEEKEKLDTKIQTLPLLISQLSNLSSYTRNEFEIKHYRGQEGLRQMLWNQLSAKRDIVAFSYRNRNDIVGKKYAEKIRQTQVDRKITLYEVENETDQNDYWYTDVKNWGKFYKSRYISPKVLKIKQHIAVFNQTVAIINWFDGEEVGLEIVNATYAETQLQLFWKFWEIAGKSTK
ncbi:hypothetical protein A2862_02415 [Candidatus Roizmanbacteria bacterium RIFCSPHIGHO2_01_FULL_38_41]|nr:MAG: hypothetical protein A2862_02415 [Candidatus Roizmanbacteria bacterium RIFCSPHIGHO2_01_FULL_38_41]OGK44448.1 MAG: hypothetical protein A2956_01240 [Candidatus Roizmanbacteria bacterium RIFCSPLOWO2_01_FULL_37_57]